MKALQTGISLSEGETFGKLRRDGGRGGMADEVTIASRAVNFLSAEAGYIGANHSSYEWKVCIVLVVFNDQAITNPSELKEGE